MGRAWPYIAFVKELLFWISLCLLIFSSTVYVLSEVPEIPAWIPIAGFVLAGIMMVFGVLAAVLQLVCERQLAREIEGRLARIEKHLGLDTWDEDKES